MSDPIWDGFYMLLRDVSKMPLSRKSMKTNYTDEDTNSVLSIAWPDLRIAIVFEKDIYNEKALKAKNWTLMKLQTGSLAAAEPLLKVIKDLAVEREVQASVNKANMTVSKLENNFLRKMVEAGVPMPDRNFKVMDNDTNKLITVPDFAWYKIGDKLVKTAVEVDGIYWHVIKDNEDLAKRYAEDRSLKNNINEKTKIAHKHDSKKRRELQARGWRVVPLSSEDLEENPDSIIRDIKKILREQAGKLNTDRDKRMTEVYKDSLKNDE